MLTTPKKSREALIADTTERLLGEWNAGIKARTPRAISGLQNVALERLAEDDAKEIFVQALTDPRGAEDRFGELVAKAVYDVCAADAERTVDLLFADMAAAKTESRIERAVEARAA